MLPYLSQFMLGVNSAAAMVLNYCALLGPNYPPPFNLSSSTSFQQAVAAFKSQLTKIPGSDSPDTAYSISISSAASNDTLFELHYTPPTVKNASHGVQTVDANSVYRIGSISKVFTVWTFLTGAGDRYFNDPVTKYVPELKALAPPPGANAVYDSIDAVNWDEVTLGNLASQMAGVERDGMHSPKLCHPFD
jgi:Beta-lactamase